ncbi:unnamed protein product [Vitrella brassicaformis CCMP3155]|uniref:B9 domain-containing protein 1 n=1 Tax=Vitrella brassicaformis (strain CCMP3155) TaxID=1169540 RepID=A0A0G4G452_VITBC|nr:unnamed protein product [Vitrella brassicaformis CCMP3155]|eukprot:CEM23188.1 unnamed protein product [Vitrella brassicaformis CCMP3155]
MAYAGDDRAAESLFEPRPSPDTNRTAAAGAAAGAPGSAIDAPPAPLSLRSRRTRKPQEDERVQRTVDEQAQAMLPEGHPAIERAEPQRKEGAAARIRTLGGGLGGSTCFEVAVAGEIENIQLPEGSRSAPLVCRYQLVYGPDWALVQGPDSGVSQSACGPLGGGAGGASVGALSALNPFYVPTPPSVVINFPFNAVFKAQNAFGWPRVLVCIYATDWCNRRVIRGYSSVHVPTQPGRHVRWLRLYCPVASSWLSRFMGWLTGNRAEYIDPKTAAHSEGREVVRVRSGGRVKVVLNVLLKDTKPFNYSF